MRVRAVAWRILHQLRHDRRTIALMMVAPLFLLTLVYFILDSPSPVYDVAVVNAPQRYVETLEQNEIRIWRMTQSEARSALLRQEVIAVVEVRTGQYFIDVDGSNSSRAKMLLSVLEQARFNGVGSVRPDLATEIHYIYGASDLTAFDNFGSALIGIIVFFFVFLVSGISFLQERTSGTLERVLSTPIRRWQIVAGYVLGFGLVTVVQSCLIAWYCVYVLGVMMVGSFALVLLLTLLAAITALTLGILLSTAANNEFQLVQFIPLVIIPQVFFCGLFDLAGWLQPISWVMPIYYIAEGLTEVMIRGGGLLDIWPEAAFLTGVSILFMALNTRALKKYRQI